MDEKNKKRRWNTVNIRKDPLGEDIYVGSDGYETVEVKRLHMADYLPTGDQWCPECHVKCIHYAEDKYWQCPTCNWAMTEEEYEMFGGYPTEAASYENEF